MIAPVQTPITPVMISVLPVLNSLIGIPKPIASRPARTRPIPATNITNTIKPTLSRARNARQPPTPRYRHIVRTANRQLHHRVPQLAPPRYRIYRPASAALSFRYRSAQLPYFYRLPIAALLLHCIRDLGHNSQLLGNGTALYGYPGNEAQEYPGWAIGTLGYQSPCHPSRLLPSIRLRGARWSGPATTSPCWRWPSSRSSRA